MREIFEIPGNSQEYRVWPCQGALYQNIQTRRFAVAHLSLLRPRMYILFILCRNSEMEFLCKNGTNCNLNPCYRKSVFGCLSRGNKLHILVPPLWTCANFPWTLRCREIRTCPYGNCKSTFIKLVMVAIVSLAHSLEMNKLEINIRQFLVVSRQSLVSWLWQPTL